MSAFTSIPAWMEQLGWVLVHFIWQGAGIGLIAWLALAVMRRASSSSRYLLLCAALVACGLAPVATWIALKAPAPPQVVVDKSVPFSANPASVAPIAQSPALGIIAVQIPPTTVPRTSRLESFARAINASLPLFVALWILGVALLSLRLAYGWIQVRQLRASGFPLEDTQWSTRLEDLAQRLDLRQTVRLLESVLVEVPTVIGWLRPVVLVPAAFISGLPPGQIEAILAHELAHVRRHDYLVNLFQVALETLLFYHPVVWWISRAIRQEREHCCDDLALNVIGDKVTYALALASLEEGRSLPTRLALAASGGSLLQRIRRIAETDRRRVSSGPVFLGMLFVLISIGALAWQTTLHAQGKPKVDPEAGSNRSVTVTCLDPAGKPVAGAEVYLLEHFRDVAAGKPGYNAGPRKTDGSGRVVFDHLDPDRELWKRLLYARVPGKFVGIDCDEMRENVAAKPRDISVQLQLLPTVTLEGRVQVLDGFLVTDVKVSIIEWMFGPDFKTAKTFSGDSRDFGGIPGLRHLVEFKPDTHGHVAISDLPIGCYIYLSGTSPRLGETQFMAVELKPKPDPFLLTLDHEGVIEGSVRDSQGKGFGGVQISCRPAPGQLYVLRSFDSVTEANGHFQFKGLPASRFEVQLSNLPDGLTCQPRNEVIVQSGKTEPLDFVISPGIELSGEVRDKQTGKGIPGVELGFLGGDNPLNGNPYAYAKTNGEGRFKVLLPPGESTCSFSNYPKNYVPPGQAGNQLFNLQAGQIPAPLLLELTSKPADAPKLSPYDAEPAVAHGRVLDLSGQPLANIEVSSNYRPKKTETYSQGHGHTVTGKDGTYTLSLLPYGTNHMIIGGVTTSSIESKDFETLPGSQHQIDDLTVRPGTATISGRVIDENGKPVANAEVTAGSEHKHPQGVGVKTDLQGKFTIDHLLDDEETFVSAGGPDYYYGTARAKPNSRDVEVTLVPTPSMSAPTKPSAKPVPIRASVTATSVPPEGIAWMRLAVDIQFVGGAAKSWTALPGGLALQAEVPQGSYRIRMVGRDAKDGLYFSEPRFLEIASAEPVNLTFEKFTPGYTVKGRLDDSVPRPVKHGLALVCVTTLSPKPLTGCLHWTSSAAINPDGTFEIANLPEPRGPINRSGAGMQLVGQLEMIATCDGYVSKDPEPGREYSVGPLTFDPPVAQPVTLAMERTGSARVRVLDPAGKPLPETKVLFSPNESFHWVSTILGSPIAQEKSLGLFDSYADGDHRWKEIETKYSATTDSEGIAIVNDLPPGVEPYVMGPSPYDTPYRQREDNSPTKYAQNVVISIKPGERTDSEVRMVVRITPIPVPHSVSPDGKYAVSVEPTGQNTNPDPQILVVSTPGTGNRIFATHLPSNLSGQVDLIAPTDTIKVEWNSTSGFFVFTVQRQDHLEGVIVSLEGESPGGTTELAVPYDPKGRMLSYEFVGQRTIKIKTALPDGRIAIYYDTVTEDGSVHGSGGPPAESPVAPDAKTTSTSEKDMTIPTRNLIVHVISTDGKPVAGATVKPMGLRTKEEPGSFYFGMLTNGKPISPPATTDASGNATIAYPVHIMDDLTTGTVAVQVQHPDACSISEELEVDAPKPVTLVRGMKVTLSALPVAGVSFSRVEAQIADPERKSDSPKWEHLPDGSVSTHLPHGEYLVRLIAATAEGKVYFSSSVPRSVPLGYVDALPDSNPGRGGSFQQMEGLSTPGQSTPNVLFSVPLTYSRAMAESDENSGRKILLPVKEGSILHGQIDPLVPRPIKGGWVIAEVTSPDLASAYGSRALPWQACADVAEDGSFTIPNLPLGMGTLQVIAGCDGYLSVNPNRESARSGVHEGRVIEDWSKPIILPMEKTGSARITVLAPDGKPLAGASVAFNPNQSLGGGTNIVGDRHNSVDYLLASEKDRERAWKPQAAKFNAKTDAQGTAVVTGLPLGSQLFMVISESFDMPIEVRKFPSIPDAIDQPRRMKTIQITADGEASSVVTMETKGSTSLSKALRRPGR